MTAFVQNAIGILPPGALGVSFFYHLTRQLTELDDSVYFLERRGSQSAKALRESGKISIATPSQIQTLPTSEILKSDLITAYQEKCLPEVILVCTNPDQILSVITTIVELLVLLYEEDKLTQPRDSLPIFILCSNGIYFQRFRQIFIEKIEEAILFGRLPELWPNLMPQIVCRLLRGVTIQTGLREGSGESTLYRPGFKGRSQLTGGDNQSRERACYILNQKGGWFEEVIANSPTRVEFDKALINLACNLLGQLYAIDSQGNFKPLTLNEILIPEHYSDIRKLVNRVFRVGQMVKVYDIQEDVDVIFNQLIATGNEHLDHIPSSLQWVNLHIKSGTLKPQLTPTEAWLLEPLVRYAKASGLEETALYFQQLKEELIGKLTLASQHQI